MIPSTLSVPPWPLFSAYLAALGMGAVVVYFRLFGRRR
jgi:hypothetical protein